MRKRSTWLIAFAAAICAFVVANAIEAALIRLTGWNAWDLAYVSDVGQRIDG